MADMTKKVFSAIVTTSDRLVDLTIKDGQLIFIQNKHKIAFDFDGKRKFYNQIEILQTEQERQLLEEPIDGFFYFVINTAVLWTYQNGWIQITSNPDEVIFIGTSLPEFGTEKTLYINKQDKCISVWDVESKSYVTIADKTNAITTEEINDLFND